MELKSLFACHLLTHTFDNVEQFNKEAKKAILDRAIHDPGLNKSNLGNTWHSNYDLHDWFPCMADYKAMVTKVATEFCKVNGAQKDMQFGLKIVPWAMISQPDGTAYGAYHTHPNCHFSSVYYVDPGKPYKIPKLSGQIEFFDPRGWGQYAAPGLKMLPQVMAFKPEAGMIHMFRGEFPHMVHPYHGKGERVAIAANITVMPVKTGDKSAGK
jgi:uncharacterized protein (TIGR02466 family)